MEPDAKSLTVEQVTEAKGRRLIAMHLQAMESNPLDPEDIAMFEMFERESWLHQRRRAYILDAAETTTRPPAAE